MSVAKDADCYNMNHEKRGKCIIFNHENFEWIFDKRVGSSLDARRLEKSFGNLGFDVEVYDDFTHNEIVSKIETGKNVISHFASSIALQSKLGLGLPLSLPLSEASIETS